MSLAKRFEPEIVRSIASGAIGAAYAAIGTAFTNPVRILFVQNLTDATLMFSFTGIAGQDHFPLPANGFLLLDVTANKTLDHGFFISEGWIIYVREIVAPTSGTVYVSAFGGTTA